MKRFQKSTRRFYWAGSLLWLVAILFFTVETESVKTFLVFGVLPVVFFWAARWVWRGYQTDLRAQKPTLIVRLKRWWS